MGKVFSYSKLWGIPRLHKCLPIFFSGSIILRRLHQHRLRMSQSKHLFVKKSIDHIICHLRLMITLFLVYWFHDNGPCDLLFKCLQYISLYCVKDRIWYFRPTRNKEWDLVTCQVTHVCIKINWGLPYWLAKYISHQFYVFFLPSSISLSSYKLCILFFSSLFHFL